MEDKACSESIVINSVDHRIFIKNSTRDYPATNIYFEVRSVFSRILITIRYVHAHVNIRIPTNSLVVNEGSVKCEYKHNRVNSIYH